MQRSISLKGFVPSGDLASLLVVKELTDQRTKGIEKA